MYLFGVATKFVRNRSRRRLFLAQICCFNQCIEEKCEKIGEFTETYISHIELGDIPVLY